MDATGDAAGARTEEGEQAILLFVNFGKEDNRSYRPGENIFALEDRLAAACEDCEAGEYDGDQFGGGFCTIYLYGPSADRIAEAIRPVLDDFPIPPGSYMVKRYGPAGAREERIELTAK